MLILRDLRARGVEFTQEIQDHGYGLVTFFKVPGEFAGSALPTEVREVKRSES